MYKVLIADDHDIIRIGLRQILENDKDQRFVISEAATVAQTTQLALSQVWDAIVLDISFSDGSGLDALQTIRGQGRTVPVLILSVHKEETYAVEAIRMGANGYLSKDGAPKELLSALTRVLEGDFYIQSSIANDVLGSLSRVGQKSALSLSLRERQVFDLLIAGRTVSEIGDFLRISPKTVSTFRKRLLNKLGLRNNLQLFRYAAKNDLVR